MKFSSPLCFRQARSKMDQNQDPSNKATTNDQDAVIKVLSNTTSSIIEKCQDAVKLPENDLEKITAQKNFIIAALKNVVSSHQDAVNVGRIMNDSSNMVDEFDVASASSDQDAVLFKVRYVILI